eukprot:gnl/MRDRNA2_/MRDRNA2_336942_c0_seq1.p1 gnl/MRDRNA2_/MRDRNA2_336942_c0~~gnl/MRDRNA2_/MRDRNA2_336942_c0_seq1.p1  ORF type:complete len:149 (+),score=8.69 gnl/MRDRNA2_/MRDRNA2_336942_c0_seq1:11-457(+)
MSETSRTCCPALANAVKSIVSNWLDVTNAHPRLTISVTVNSPARCLTAHASSASNCVLCYEAVTKVLATMAKFCTLNCLIYCFAIFSHAAKISASNISADANAHTVLTRSFELMFCPWPCFTAVANLENMNKSERPAIEIAHATFARF